MLLYANKPENFIKANDLIIASFLKGDETNIDWRTIKTFGEEWEKFHSFSEKEIDQIGNDYFDLVVNSILNKEVIALDVGCGSGRWTKFVAPKVKFVEAIDPSQAVFSAAKFLSVLPNVRVTQSSVDNIPFADNSFDFVYSLGVLHHVPHTPTAIRCCYEKIRPAGWFLLYLYYDLENRSFIYKMIFRASDLLRMVICALPGLPKRIICDTLAILIYLPLTRISLFFSIFSKRLADLVPLAYYRKTSFHIMRNDALDRFGTPLEKRFSKKEIGDMLITCGFKNIRFSDIAPFWHVIAQK